MRKIVDAAQQYRQLRDRGANPAGSFDRKGRWYPESYAACCRGVGGPSAAHPYSLLLHCRTAIHIARVHDVDERLLRHAALLLDEGHAPSAIAGALAVATARLRVACKDTTPARLRRIIAVCSTCT